MFSWQMRLPWTRFSYTISHAFGNDLIIPDTLSRALIYRKVSCEEQALADDVNACVDFALKSLPTTGSCLREIQDMLQQAVVFRQIMSHCENGWPEKQYIKAAIKPFYQFAEELSIEEGITTHFFIRTLCRASVLKVSLLFFYFERSKFLDSFLTFFSRQNNRQKQDTVWLLETNNDTF